ncbi:TrmH family RNA methyltransferase [Bacillus sp. 1NLA3E]|uniref:TrmH family RNA methyltransferase n=1 Tax=Bacillus sp. 1NLA3E TaxID=666686 RepID=UPI000247E92A|nr:RNA methyltransferase [Bacillus sp. 1NLA3E]AGK55153.1 23S rRNA methyltransferase [Bacillus sp. 1NLA3E]
MKHIHSVKNPQIKEWKKLLTKKERDKTGTFLIEGFHLVEEALKKEDVVLELIVDEQVELPAKWNYGSIPLTLVTVEVIKSLSDTETPQGVIAICRQEQEKNTDIIKKTYLLIDSVQDPGNMGTMIRTADAAGIDAVIVGNGSVDIYNPKVLRSAQGSHFHLPIVTGDLANWIDKLSMENIPVYGTSLENGQILTNVSPTESFALIVGNEGNGVSQQLLEKTTENLYIPILGQSESLNVAVATGILLYFLKKVL